MLQSKYSATHGSTQWPEVEAELEKLRRTLTGPTRINGAEIFVNELKSRLHSRTDKLEYIWVTTKDVSEEVRERALKWFEKLRAAEGWSLQFSYVPVHRKRLQGVVCDVRLGNVPYTGEHVLKLSTDHWIQNRNAEVPFAVVVIRVRDILLWFSREEAPAFLQKNVRGYLGDDRYINRKLADSFTDQPEWFWYKHNGIILFADHFKIDVPNNSIVMQNPQIVNGGQTAIALWSAFERAGRPDNDATALLRVYELPYADMDTYERGLEIIRALNSHNKVQEADLHSNDARQVRVEILVAKSGMEYKRKRGRRPGEIRATKNKIPMQDLALLYWVASKKAPHDGVTNDREELFRDQTKYSWIFPEDRINQDFGSSHVVHRYLDAWVLYQILKTKAPPISKTDEDLRKFTRYFLLADYFEQLQSWRQKRPSMGTDGWRDFVSSESFARAVSSAAKISFAIAVGIAAHEDETGKFYRSIDAKKRYFRRRKKQALYRRLDGAFRRFEQAR